MVARIFFVLALVPALYAFQGPRVVFRTTHTNAHAPVSAKLTPESDDSLPISIQRRIEVYLSARVRISSDIFPQSINRVLP